MFAVIPVMAEILRNLTMNISANLYYHYKISEKSGFSIPDFFKVPTTPTKEKLVRICMPFFLNLLSPKLSYFATNFMKKLRNPSGKLEINYPLSFKECRLLSENLKTQNLKPWWDKKAVVCIGHDVDNKKGYDFVKTLVEIEISNNIQSTYYLITHGDYKIDTDMISFLTKNDFEIGLHGYTHDQGFAFRNLKTIKKEMVIALSALEKKVCVGYRAPALCVSDALFNTLKENKFLYDSSLQIASPFYYSVKFPYPCYIEKYQIWELPLMIQDDNYFRDTNTSEEKTFNSIRRLINETIALNGVFVINMHPHLMVEHKDFYINFIKVLKEFEQEMIFTTAKKVIEYITNHSKN